MKSLTKLKCLFAAFLRVHHLPLLPLQEYWHWDPDDNMPSPQRPHISHLILSLLCHTHTTPAFCGAACVLKTPAIWQWECRAQLIPGERAAMQWRCFSRSPLIRVSATGSWCGEESRNWIKSGPTLFSLAQHFLHRAEWNWTKITRVCKCTQTQSEGTPSPVLLTLLYRRVTMDQDPEGRPCRKAAQSWSLPC